MKQNSLAAWPSILPESTMTTAFNTRAGSQKTGIVKLLAPPAPPDDQTIRKLNALAAKQPFCSMHRVKKHDTL